MGQGTLVVIKEHQQQVDSKNLCMGFYQRKGGNVESTGNIKSSIVF
jgi:hypothetical protein